MRIRALLSAVGLNAVPAAGWFLGEWSAGTTLLVYWLETLFGAFFVTARILLHRRLVPKQGHWAYETPRVQGTLPSGRSTYLAAFLAPVLVFSVAHGVFLAAIGALMIGNQLAPEATIDLRSVRIGVIGVLLVQAVDFLFDLIWLRSRSFRWIERLGQQSFGRVAVIHLTIVGGMCAVMFTGTHRDFFGVFIFLKAMLNASHVLPQYNPETPPAWLSYLMDQIPSHGPDDGTTFAEFWKKTDEGEATRITRNEAYFARTSKRQK